MDELKLCSLRLEIVSLEWADQVAFNSSYWSRSDVLRLAIWVGSKIITPHHLHDIAVLKWNEDFKGTSVTLENVLRTVGIELENLKSQE